ncbi:MAG TPA: helix-turn-helix domain-containing protein [Micromonosporaceae bacterium]|nr:helix-turn-helix domain-containing protein [Micromonosporaceae bacterium]
MAATSDDVQVLVSGPPLARREVTDADTLRVMSDPLRIAILRRLMSHVDGDVRVMSAKELAAELGEPQTKLYRHLKQLEEAHLIEVAETRVVSGINEQRYRTAQLSLLLSPALLSDPGVRDDVADTIVAALDGFRDDMVGNLRAGRVDMRGSDSAESGPGGLLMQVDRRMSPPQAMQFAQRLAALVEEIEAAPDVPSGIPVRALIGWYGLTDPA